MKNIFKIRVLTDEKKQALPVASVDVVSAEYDGISNALLLYVSENTKDGFWLVHDVPYDDSLKIIKSLNGEGGEPDFDLSSYVAEPVFSKPTCLQNAETTVAPAPKKDIPNECCVCILIAVDHKTEEKEVLLIRKNKTVFKTRYNGVGGKRMEGENWLECAEREIREETGADMRGRLAWLGKTVIPTDVKRLPVGEGDLNRGDFTPFTLQFYTGIVDKNEVSQKEEERLEWFPLADLLAKPVTDDTIAGDGDLLYFLRKAAILYGWSNL